MQFRSNYNSWVDVLASRQMCNTSKLVPSMRLLGKFLINFNASFALIAKPHGSHQHLHLRAKNEETKAMQSWNWNQTTPENRPMPHQFQMNEHCFAALCFQRTTVLFVFPSANQHIAPLGQATEYPWTCGPKVHGPAEAAYMDEEIQLHMSSMVLVCSCAWLASVRRKKMLILILFSYMEPEVWSATKQRTSLGGVRAIGAHKPSCNEPTHCHATCLEPCVNSHQQTTAISSSKVSRANVSGREVEEDEPGIAGWVQMRSWFLPPGDSWI